MDWQTPQFLSRQLRMSTKLRPGAWLRHMYDLANEFLFGAAISWAAVPYQLKRRKEFEDVFVAYSMLAIWGISPLPPTRRLFLLPHVIPQILYWRRRLALWDESLETADLKHLGH